jgi:membrane-associated phospholipid phosphatase
VESRDAIAATSHLLSFILLPLGGVTSVVALPLLEGGSGRHAAENMVILTEVALVNFAVTLAAKKMVARQRPAFHYRRAGATEFSRTRVEQNLSFFSGDTSVAFSTASGAATIAFMRGYGSAPYVTAGGAVLAVATGAMRVAADVHWPTDVLTGAFVGTAVGIAIPLLLHPRSSPSQADGQSSYRLSEPLDAPALFTFGGAF